ncbi:MAG TPA: hypothetical protein VH561_15430 [Micromonosporaceae bacterium]
MDFWDLTRVLFRRWYLSVPGLVLTIIASAGMLVTGHPKYVATSYVQVAPPVARKTTAGEPSLAERNPWMGLGAQTLANTAMVTVTEPSVLASLRAAGYSDTFTATLDNYSPLVTFEVTGATREQAIATTDEVIRRFTASVTDLQVNVYGVAPEDQASAKRLDTGNNITESTSSILRAAVAVGGVFLLLTLGLTIGVDALATRRIRRRASGSPGLSIEDLSPLPAGPAPVPAAPPRMPVTPAISSVASSVLDRGPVTEPSGPRLDDTDGGATSAGTANPDSTVVLPLAYRSSRRLPEDRGAGRR